MSIRLGVFGSLLATFLFGCLGLPDMSPDSGSGVEPARRLYVNDPANNDSLARSLFNGGVEFVVQPGQNYAVQVKLSKAGDRLAVYSNSNSGWAAWRTLDAQLVNGMEVFSLTPDASITKASLFAAVFLPIDTGAFSRLKGGTTRPWIRLLDTGVTESHALLVHLFMVGKLRYFPTMASKQMFGQKIIDSLRVIYAKYGVTVSSNSTAEIVGDTSVRSGMTFSSTLVSLPGTRVPGAAHFYLVDTIAAVGGGTILGYAPREVLDLYQDPSSRVILNASITDPGAVATTAAHELGHFFGFRHVMATNVDFANDRDTTNADDGFSSTPACPDMILALAKKEAAFSAYEKEVFQNGRPYCLYMAATTASQCPAACGSAYQNLMWAYYCQNTVQQTLTSEQQIFVRRNMTILGSK